MASEQKPLKLTVKLAGEIIRNQFGAGSYDFEIPVRAQEVAAILNPVLQNHLKLLKIAQRILSKRDNLYLWTRAEIDRAIHKLEHGEGSDDVND